jgi:hypothetical protein
MRIKDSEIYRHILESEIRRHASRHFCLLIEEDLARWAAEREGDLKGNPPASSVVDGRTGVWGILLRRTFDEDWVASIIDRIEYGGFIRAREVLDSPETFLCHLVLHELAHLENNWGQDQEGQCDAWAFEKLGLKAI